METLKRCVVCQGKNDILKCSRCRVTRYCSVACQRKDWKCHKSICGVQQQAIKAEKSELDEWSKKSDSGKWLFNVEPETKYANRSAFRLGAKGDLHRTHTMVTMWRAQPNETSIRKAFKPTEVEIMPNVAAVYLLRRLTSSTEELYPNDYFEMATRGTSTGLPRETIEASWLVANIDIFGTEDTVFQAGSAILKFTKQYPPTVLIDSDWKTRYFDYLERDIPWSMDEIQLDQFASRRGALKSIAEEMEEDGIDKELLDPWFKALGMV